MAVKALLAALILSILASACFAQASALVVDHTAVDAFTNIPDWAISAAAAKTSMLRRASVGGNIDSGLNALQSQDSRYSRAAWQFQNRGNPSWSAKISDFTSQASSHASSFEVMAMKFCFIDFSADFEQYRAGMESAEAGAQGKIVVWWTMPTVKGDSHNEPIEAFNGKVRAYVRANGKTLFDLADIESHRADGSSCNYRGFESLCPEWTSDGGHLTSDGSLRAAKAYWYLMARAAGWEGAASGPQQPPQEPEQQEAAQPSQEPEAECLSCKEKRISAEKAAAPQGEAQASQPSGEKQPEAPSSESPPKPASQSEIKGEMLIIPFIVLFGCAVAITAIFLMRRKPPKIELGFPQQESLPLYSPPSMDQRPPVQPPASGQE